MNDSYCCRCFLKFWLERSGLFYLRLVLLRFLLFVVAVFTLGSVELALFTFKLYRVTWEFGIYKWWSPNPHAWFGDSVIGVGFESRPIWSGVTTLYHFISPSTMMGLID